MCVYSNVLDHFEPLIPWPQPQTAPAPQWPWTPQLDLTELKELLREFKEAMAAARKVDAILGHPDCESADKAKLLARIAELEQLMSTQTRIVYRVRDTVNGGWKLAHEGYVPKPIDYPTAKAARHAARYLKHWRVVKVTIRPRPVLRQGEDT